jgi:undecaprenyl-diphosphatase
MNAFDLSIISFINQFAHHSMVFDYFVKGLADNYLITSVPITAMLWWVWFERNERQITNQKFVISLFISCILACIIFILLRDGRFLIPSRVRPSCNPDLFFQIPYSMDQVTINNDICSRLNSSFPSGHAAVLFAISVGLVYIKKYIGWLCLTFSFIICFRGSIVVFTILLMSLLVIYRRWCVLFGQTGLYRKRINRPADEVVKYPSPFVLRFLLHHEP